MQIDHVIIAVNDLDAAAQRLRERFGLNAIGGGTLPIGTANRLVPLKPPQYLELLAIDDEAIARSNPFGRLLMQRLSSGDCLLGWGVRVDDIIAEGTRLGRPVIPGMAVDGAVGRWHQVFADLDDFEKLPFLIHYKDADSFRREAAYAEANSPAQPGAISWLEVGDERQRMLDWLGTDNLPLRSSMGAPGLHAIAIESPGGEIVIENGNL